MSQVDLSRVNGKYHLVSQENYEEYLKAIGLNVAKRALAMNEKTHIDCHVDGDDWSIEIKGMRDAAFKFRLGVEAKRTTADGRHVTDLFKLEEGEKVKLIQTERWGDNQEAVMTHELDGDEWIMTIKCGNCTSVRHFRRD